MKNPESMVELMDAIKEVTKKQKSQNVSDEIKIQKCMLNDPEFKVGVYDKKKGLTGVRCPREEAVNFIAEVSSDITGLDKDSAIKAANEYEFSKKDAQFFLNMNRDFTTTYLKTGRKFGIIQSEDCEASLLYRPTASREKIVPSAEGNKITTVPGYTKLISKSKAPKYLGNN